jgi:hypothetical protein
LKQYKPFWEHIAEEIKYLIQNNKIGVCAEKAFLSPPLYDIRFSNYVKRIIYPQAYDEKQIAIWKGFFAYTPVIKCNFWAYS